MTNKEMLHILKTNDKEELDLFYKKAYDIKLKYIGNNVYYRGLIEFSNECVKDCLYCGIRRSNEVSRYFNTKEEILERAKWAYENNYASVTLQSGERYDSKFIYFVEDVIIEIKKIGDLGITISLGEQKYETYKRWFDAGAHRYLLRIESSNKELYEKIHPNNPLHSFETRVNCLKMLKEIGYQVGTGVMIGLPFQSDEILASDIEFFKEMDIDMIGMGPYVVSKNTPLGKWAMNNGLNTEDKIHERYEKSIKMIALTRTHLKDVNIAATTALQALNPQGREEGLLAGANILMPIITPDVDRKNYTLYDNKPCIEDTSDQCKNCLSARIASIGENIGYDKWGDSPHFKKIV